MSNGWNVVCGGIFCCQTLSTLLIIFANHIPKLCSLCFISVLGLNISLSFVIKVKKDNDIPIYIYIYNIYSLQSLIGFNHTIFRETYSSRALLLFERGMNSFCLLPNWPSQYQLGNVC